MAGSTLTSRTWALILHEYSHLNNWLSRYQDTITQRWESEYIEKSRKEEERRTAQLITQRSRPSSAIQKSYVNISMQLMAIHTKAFTVLFVHAIYMRGNTTRFQNMMKKAYVSHASLALLYTLTASANYSEPSPEYSARADTPTSTMTVN